MSTEKSYSVTLKLSTTEWGTFESIRLLKGRSKMPEEILENINLALRSTLVPSAPVKTTVAIGDDAEQKIMQHLLSLSMKNMDFQVNDTSSQTGHGDMSVSHQTKRICIEVKSYTKPVPMKEIEKYHRSLAFAEYDAGIMINVNPCGYAREANIRSPIDLRFEEGKPSVYLTAIDMELIYPVINMLVVSCNLGDSIDESELESKRKSLLAIHEKIADLRTCVASQKKMVARMEATIEDIAKLSLN